MNTQLDKPPTFSDMIPVDYEPSYESQTVDTIAVEPPAPPPVVEVAVMPTEITSLRVPVDGEIIKYFSNDELVFSNTMNDWRVHRGIDIAAPLGTQVRAAADGVVEQVFTDDLLGVVVVIGHVGGFQTLYASLQNEDFISVGTRVSEGDIIGGVGDTAIIKSADGPLLYFEVHRNGQHIDPVRFFTTI